jgi:hypothetical protein
LRPEEKLIFFTEKVVFSADPSTDAIWIPKAIELVTPYLKDENRFLQLI